MGNSVSIGFAIKYAKNAEKFIHIKFGMIHAIIWSRDRFPDSDEKKAGFAVSICRDINAAAAFSFPIYLDETGLDEFLRTIAHEDPIETKTYVVYTMDLITVDTYKIPYCRNDFHLWKRNEPRFICDYSLLRWHIIDRNTGTIVGNYPDKREDHAKQKTKDLNDALKYGDNYEKMRDQLVFDAAEVDPGEENEG